MEFTAIIKNGIEKFICESTIRNIQPRNTLKD